jgi:hypothetical protein
MAGMLRVFMARRNTAEAPNRYDADMARLLPFLVFIALAIFFAAAVTSTRRGPRGTHRPRAKWRFGTGAAPPPARPGTVHIVPRAQLDGLRDAYSSEPIDAARALARCGGCQALYHAESVQALRRDNQGRCAVCGSTDLGPVRVTDD